MSDGKPPPGSARSVDADTLKAFSHPLRMRLYDHLKDHGPATASQLARAMDESSGQTSYHLRQLERHGLVAEDTTRGTARERWWKAESFAFDVVGLDAESRTSAEAIQRHQVATRAAHQLAAIERQHAEPAAWHDASISSEATVRMTAAEAAALHADVGRVIDEHIRSARTRRSASGEADTRMLKAYYVGFPLPEEEVD
ncbi:helix-turn-helix domain-containing protein [Alteromonas gracilis]